MHCSMCSLSGWRHITSGRALDIEAEHFQHFFCRNCPLMVLYKVLQKGAPYTVEVFWNFSFLKKIETLDLKFCNCSVSHSVFKITDDVLGYFKLRFNISKNRLPKITFKTKSKTFFTGWRHLLGTLELWWSSFIFSWKGTPDMDFVPVCTKTCGSLFINPSVVTQLGVTNIPSNRGFIINCCK